MAIQGKVYPAVGRLPVENPFILIAHHKDNYPEGNEDMSPRVRPVNWSIGHDFESGRGYNMYHEPLSPVFLRIHTEVLKPSPMPAQVSSTILIRWEIQVVMVMAMFSG